MTVPWFLRLPRRLPEILVTAGIALLLVPALARLGMPWWWVPANALLVLAAATAELWSACRARRPG